MNWNKKNGNKTEEKEEEGGADDQCSADMLLRGVIITVWYVEPVWISWSLSSSKGFKHCIFKTEAKKRDQNEN